MAKKNLLALIASQANTGREIKGLVCKVVPDNEKYEVIEYDAEGERLVLQQILPEGAEEQPEQIVITKANELVAHYAYNPNERPAPDAEIIEENGKKMLKIDENKILMGNIPGIKVLGGKSGQVLFTTETDEENKVGLYGYDVQMDTFYQIYAEIEETAFLAAIDETHTYLIENIIRDEPVLDKDGNETKDAAGNIVTEPVFKEANIYGIYASRSENSVRLGITLVLGSDGSYDEYDDEYDEDDEYEEYDEPAETEFDAPIVSVRLVKQSNRSDIVVVTKSLDGKKITMKLFIDNDLYFGARVGTFDLKSETAKIFLGGSSEKPPVVTVKDDGVILIRTQRGMLVVDDDQIVTEMAGFDYFCGVFCEKDDEDRDVSVWAYANANRSLVKKFSSVATDRGVLFATV